jgi:hypothetical protein
MPVLVIRRTGDEASGVLTTASLLTWLLERAWKLGPWLTSRVFDKTAREYLAAAKLDTGRSTLLLEQFPNPRLLCGFQRALVSAGDPPFQLLDVDLVSGSWWPDAYGQRGQGTAPPHPTQG